MSANFLVLTYNVGNGRANPVRLVDMLKSSGADIVALQELNELQALEIEKKLQSCFPFRAMFPGGFAGKAILSHFPIINSVQLELKPSCYRSSQLILHHHVCIVQVFILTLQH
jgi:endonuclease/exonuclease/phosphatase family metal-dependent hydrolase